ncbi:nuclease-related domain-containing protein [Desulfolithobacter sp.]
MAKAEKKSPLKGKPLRYVGQSLDEQIDKLINEDALSYFLVSCLMVSLAAIEWWRYYKHPEPSPRLYTFLALLWISFSIYKVRKILKQVQKLKLGRDGERAVGQYLENLRESGCRVFHDLLGDNFNIDHVIISEKGIFVIETKTYSKPSKGAPSIVFDGSFLDIKGVGKKTEPVTQVVAAANWLRKVIAATTGKNFFIKPVILFPGWYVTMTAQGRKSGIWVLEPKALPKFIQNHPPLLSQADMMLASYHISRYIRAKEAERTR